MSWHVDEKRRRLGLGLQPHTTGTRQEITTLKPKHQQAHPNIKQNEDSLVFRLNLYAPLLRHQKISRFFSDS
ncbi:hypothetical protein L1987_81194 [Smallanthus sonchifolius]|uniref:Uncharacterized protein n=1 Tax=Smallanthus sonchifolius TaxID=185202 RepID=A0ACB8YPS0_9ASTR|nr:hypothetical protein L1987_81194 [Smallanthus sonchifolius]